MFPLLTNGPTTVAANDAEIDAAVASDPDWAEFEPIEWSKAEMVVPPKKPEKERG